MLKWFKCQPQFWIKLHAEVLTSNKLFKKQFPHLKCYTCIQYLHLYLTVIVQRNNFLQLCCINVKHSTWNSSLIRTCNIFRLPHIGNVNRAAAELLMSVKKNVYKILYTINFYLRLQQRNQTMCGIFLHAETDLNIWLRTPSALVVQGSMYIIL